MAVEKEKLQEKESVILRFYKIILSWDYLALKESKQQEEGTAESTLSDTFALVEHVRKYFDTRLVRVRLYLAGEFLKFDTDDVKSCPRLFNMRSHICKTERQLYFVKQCSLSTIAREYLAIRTLGCLPYKDLILSAVGENFGTEVNGWKIPTPNEYVENSFNQYQREAISFFLEVQ